VKVEVFRAVGDEGVRVEVEVYESGLARIRILSPKGRFLEADLLNGVVFLYEVSEEAAKILEKLTEKRACLACRRHRGDWSWCDLDS